MQWHDEYAARRPEGYALTDFEFAVNVTGYQTLLDFAGRYISSHMSYRDRVTAPVAFQRSSSEGVGAHLLSERRRVEGDVLARKIIRYQAAVGSFQRYGTDPFGLLNNLRDSEIAETLPTAVLDCLIKFDIAPSDRKGADPLMDPNSRL